MSYENVQRITELSVAFKDAIEGRYGNDNALKAKVMKALKPGEMERLVDQLQDLSMEALQYAFGGKPSEEFLKKNIGIAEITADIFTRVLPEEKVAEFLPAGLKNAEDEQFLRQEGFTKLAKLSAMKPK